MWINIFNVLQGVRLVTRNNGLYFVVIYIRVKQFKNIYKRHCKIAYYTVSPQNDIALARYNFDGQPSQQLLSPCVCPVSQ